MIKKILIFISIIIIPIIFSVLIFHQIILINKDKTEYKLAKGKIENLGFTDKIHLGSYKSPTTRTKVLFLKLKDNDTLYSFFYRSEFKYEKIINNLKKNDFVKIYNEGFDKRQNTVDIIQLENEKEILIDKNVTDKRNYVLLALFSMFLFFYFFLPYKFIFAKSKNHKKHFR